MDHSTGLAAERHLKSQKMVTMAIGLVYLTHYITLYIPVLEHYAPLAGLTASLFWIWSE